MLVDVLESAKDYELRFNNYITLISLYFNTFKFAFKYNYLTRETKYWDNEAPFRPTKEDTITWDTLAKILSELANVITRPTKIEEIKFETIIANDKLLLSTDMVNNLINYYNK